MKWTRRNFLQLTGGLTSALALGMVPEIVESLKGRAVFEDWRALPGTSIGLSLEVDEPDRTLVEIIVEDKSSSYTVAQLKGASKLDVVVPFLKTEEESYLLYARVTDPEGRCLKSEPVEIIAESFRFGL